MNTDERRLNEQSVECGDSSAFIRIHVWFLAIMLLGRAAANAQFQSVIDSPHNLSTFGPGVIRAATEEQVCIFCHTPHNASPVQPLWNRHLPVSAYTVYSSSSLDAKPGQPTGASKMCLSCHDGTIAIGSVFSRDQIIQMASGITTIPPGQSNLGTDLSDDHPISFRYDSALVLKDPKLVHPQILPQQVKLDFNQELQCTTCHNPHNNAWGDFLVMSNTNSGLCRSCHQISDTTITSHMDCVSCHRTHTAPSGPFLLRRATVTGTCLDCHNGSRPSAWNIAAELQRISVHDTNSPIDPHDAIPAHSTCADCHEPHSMFSGTAVAPQIQPVLGKVSGVNVFGAPVTAASFEYEVCFKCHANQNATNRSWISRQITQTNTRLEFDVSAVSFHPVVGPGRNLDVPSLRPGWTPSSVMYCSDCHGSDTSRKAAGPGGGPNGVHGSNQRPLLIARYQTADFTPESASNYALCYQCHERTGGMGGILDDASFPYHRLHIVDARTPCSACHDAHGISSVQGTRRNNSHLINFDTSIVFPDRLTGLLRFEDLGTYSGSCTLTCHGVDHSPKRY